MYDEQYRWLLGGSVQETFTMFWEKLKFCLATDNTV